MFRKNHKYTGPTKWSDRFVALALIVFSISLGMRLFSAGHSRVGIRRTDAQAIGPSGGISRVNIASGSMCVGTGSSGSALNCTPTTDGTLTGTGSAGSPLSAAAALGTLNFGWFGDGSDGTVTFDGTTTILGLVPSSNTYTMTRDIFCHNCTINSGVSITGGYRFLDDGVLVLNGKIHRNGGAGSTPTGGIAPVSALFQAGQNGGAGGSTAGAAATAGTNSPQDAPNGCVTSFAAAAANGGRCQGGGGGAGAGGVGAVGGNQPQIGVGNVNVLWQGFGCRQGSSVTYSAGTGGGGGRGDAANVKSGGGGGGSGGCVVVSARQITGSGSIEAHGGAGANGQAGGNTGGGGGGGGSLVMVFIGTGTCPTIDVTGGAAGAGVGTGTSGGTGGNGVSHCMKGGY